MFLNKLEITFQKANKIVIDFAAIDSDKIRKLHQYFPEFQLVYQYVYTMLFPNMVLNIKFAVEDRSKLILHYKDCVDSKKNLL